MTTVPRRRTKEMAALDVVEAGLVMQAEPEWHNVTLFEKRTYPFPTLEAAQRFAERHAEQAGIERVAVTSPSGNVVWDSAAAAQASRPSPARRGRRTG